MSRPTRDPGYAIARGAPASPSAPVPSPCISVCRIDPASGLREGCLRTLDETGVIVQLRLDSHGLSVGIGGYAQPGPLVDDDKLRVVLPKLGAEVAARR